MAAYEYELRVPKDRIAVLIGVNGEMKNDVEQATSTKISIDSEEGDVKVSGDDAITLYSAREIITAIGRGFNPEKAMLLLKQDYALQVINIKDYAKTKNDMIRLKGRIIGSEGKSRHLIEELTETDICVYGKTVSIIGEVECVSTAIRAVESLLKGSPHGNVYKWLEKQKKLRKTEMFEKK
jgi:ribosomal RNA assembly protein